MTRFTNAAAVPLSLAVFLATDGYDYNTDPDTISATTLLKPLRQIILSARVPEDLSRMELVQLLQSRMGSAIHDAIERAWKTNHQQAMKLMGYPQRVIDRIRVNPLPGDLLANPDIIPVYLEQRATKQVGKWTVTGKYDFVGEGRVEDFKTTSTYTAINHTNDDKYIWQGSLYRWLNPSIITKDEMAIQWIFTDWSAAKAKADPKYPQSRTMQKLFPLKSVQETNAFVLRKLAAIEQYWNAPEAEIPQCDDADLWRSEPVFKYYKNGDVTAARSTKNFTDKADAYTHLATQGGGAIKEVPGQVMACKYCPAFAVCSQKDALIASGDLVM